MTSWRQIKYVVAQIIHRDGLEPRRSMLLEIGFPQEPAIGTHKRVDLVCSLASVESVAPFLANQSQRSRQIWVLEDIAFTGRAFFAIKRVCRDKCSGQFFVEARTERPVIRD